MVPPGDEPAVELAAHVYRVGFFDWRGMVLVGDTVAINHRTFTKGQAVAACEKVLRVWRTLAFEFLLTAVENTGAVAITVTRHYSTGNMAGMMDIDEREMMPDERHDALLWSTLDDDDLAWLVLTGLLTETQASHARRVRTEGA